MATKEYQRIWREKNKEKALGYSRKWIKTHRKESRAKSNKHYHSHKDVIKLKKKKIVSEWISFFAHITKCEICGKPISFASGDNITSIHFDHRHGNKKTITQPAAWIRSHKRSPENEKIWLAYSFGSLCLICNKSIPTLNRDRWLKQATNYIHK